MRIFGGDRMKSMMGKFGIPEDEPINNSLISKAIENAQGKIEGFNFDSRKRTLEYDNVLNTQRNSVYKRRRSTLNAPVEEIKEYILSISPDVSKTENLIKEKIEIVGEDTFWKTVRRIVLYVNDILWTEHLETMDHVRSSVNLRAYGQREPIIEYKKEGLILFQQMEASLNEQVLSLIETIKPKEVEAPVEQEKPKTYITSGGGEDTPAIKPTKNSEMDNIGRNDWVILEKDGKTEEVKFKKAENMIAEGWVLKGKKDNS